MSDVRLDNVVLNLRVISLSNLVVGMIGSLTTSLWAHVILHGNKSKYVVDVLLAI